MFQLQETSEMEHEVYQYLDWGLFVELGTLKEFEDMVHKDFAGPGLYHMYVLQMISKLATTTANPSCHGAQQVHLSHTFIQPTKSISTNNLASSNHTP